MYVRFKDGNQDKFPVWENIVLIDAKTDKEAHGKAKLIALDSEGDSSGSFTWEDRPATWVYGGIRKLILTENPDKKPSHGAEVTYSQFEVDSEDSLSKLIDGEVVEVLYEE